MLAVQRCYKFEETFLIALGDSKEVLLVMLHGLCSKRRLSLLAELLALLWVIQLPGLLAAPLWQRGAPVVVHAECPHGSEPQLAVAAPAWCCTPLVHWDCCLQLCLQRVHLCQPMHAHSHSLSG